MIYFGPAGYPTGSRGPLEALERIRALKLNALEVQFVRQVRMGEDKARAAEERARDLGILLSAHAPYYVNFNSPSRTTVRKSGEWVMKAARAAHQMGAWIIVLHAAAYSGKDPKAATRSVIRGVTKCRDQMEKEGIDVLLGLETMGKKGSWGTIEEIAHVVREIEGTAPVLDFAHLHARSGGGLRTVSDFRRVLVECGEFYRGHLHCHFSCVEYTEAGERSHLPMSAKAPDYALLVAALKEEERGVTVISETPLLERDAVRMMRMHGAVGEGPV